MEPLKKILIVDDNETNLYSLKKIIGRLPVEIDTAISGFVGIDLANSKHYSLALVDIQMPEMDGFETMKHLRLTPGHEFIPIILVSAIYTEDQYKIRGMETGAVDFIPKPVNPDILRAKVQVFLDLEENRMQLNTLIEELKVKNQELKTEIKHRKQVEKELREAKRAAEKTSELKGQLLVNMSHEIRTPVNSILGFADLLTSPAVTTADKERYLRYVSSSSHNLLFLLDEVLEHSRLESGEVRISLSPCNLTALCHEICESFEKIREQSGKHSISIRTELPSKEENKTIITDPHRVRQVISNLVNNALKYTNSGTITFGYLHNENEIEFFIRDTGIGIPPEDLDEIFNRFKRAENQPELTAPGTGLGLSIARSIISNLGGRIWVESEIGKGSIFRFTIPLNIATESDQLVKELVIDDSILEPDWHGRTIMIAEDEELNFLFLKEALKPTFIIVHWAKNGQESVDLAKKHPEIELALMDIKMPDMDGYEATRQIKTMRPDLPIIIQTAFALSDEKAKSVKQGGDGFITKPINRQLLIRTVSRFLR
ncbi:MAG TPA: hypothetical protein DC042_01525 [Bacteroidales bacterium]|nr:hypothetical protein [Bacteroidales bacterium]